MGRGHALARRLLVAGLLLAGPFAGLGPGGGACALAEDGAGSALDRLTPADVEYLRRNVRDWDDLPAERRERIAANVLRLRSLTPEERVRFQERVDRFRREEPVQRERLPERLAHLTPGSRDRFQVQALIATAVGHEVLRGLPEEARRVLAAVTLPEGPVRPAVLGFAFSRAVMDREADAIARSGAALRHEPSPEARPRFEALLARANAAPAEDRPREVRALASLVVEDKARRAVRDAAPGPRGPRPPWARGDSRPAVVAALRAAFPEAWEATAEDLRDRIRRGPEDVRRLLVRFGPRPDKPVGARGAAAALVRFLEQAAPWLAHQPEARERADRLLETVFVRGLGVPAATLERLPGWDRPADRVRALKRLLLAR